MGNEPDGGTRLIAFGGDGSVDIAVLIHPGIVESRPDGERLYNRLGEIIRYLKKKGYRFDRLP